MNYKKILHRHLTDSFLKDIPERLGGLEDVKTDVNMGMMTFLSCCVTVLLLISLLTIRFCHSFPIKVPEPDLDTPIFCKVLTDIGEVLLEPGCVIIGLHSPKY